jgi:flagellar basal-body rod protein FlgF
VIYGLYQSAAGMMVNEYRQGVVANNLANAETTGFRRAVAVFAERDPARDAGLRGGPSDATLGAMTGGTWAGRTEIDFQPGSLVHTGNPTDVALDGPGFFLVEKDGRTLATRDGRMRANRDGFLVSAADGARMLGRAGQPLRVDPRGEAVQIDEAGRIRQGARPVGQIGVVDFADPRLLDPVEGQRFDAQGARQVEPVARVVQGATESAGIEPVRELVSMLEASRAYQLNASMVTLQDHSLGQLIRVLTA